MKLSKSIKPISYLKAHASEIVRDAATNGSTYIITQNGEAKVAVQDIKEYEKTQDTLAMLKILAMSQASLRKGKSKPIKKAFADVQKRINKYKKECGIK
jgi:prevent-host-death family protein